MAITKTPFRFDLDKSKYKDVILYLIDQCGGKIEGKKKLAKLLYFCEFDFFEKYDNPLINETFRKYPMGPLPVNMEPMVNQLEKEGFLKIEKKKYTGLANKADIYTIVNKFEPTSLQPEEKQMIDRVARLYCKKTGTDLENITHTEAPWNAVEQGEVINYELAFYRDTDFSDLK